MADYGSFESSSGLGMLTPMSPGNEAASKNEVHANLVPVVLQLVICGIGLIGNMVAVGIIVLAKEFRKATASWFVLQLAIANALFLLTLPFRAAEQLNGVWMFSSGLCKAKETIMFLNYYASIIFITIMSVDQYVTIRSGHANVRAKRRSWLVAYITTALTWICCLLMCIPVILYSEKIQSGSTCICIYEFPMSAEEQCQSGTLSPAEMEACVRASESSVDKGCKFQTEGGSNTTSFIFDYNLTALYDMAMDYYDYYEETNDLSDLLTPDCHYLNAGQPFKIFLYFNFVVMFLAPFLIMVVVYGLVIRLILRRPKGRPIEPGTSAGAASAELAVLPKAFKQERKRMRITIMCVIFVAIFVICWLPFHSVHLAKMVGISTHFESTLCMDLSIATSLLAYTHAAVNPYLYIFARGTRKIKSALRINKNKVLRATSQFTKTLALNSSSATLTDSIGIFSKRQRTVIQLEARNEMEDVNATTTTKQGGHEHVVDTTTV